MPRSFPFGFCGPSYTAQSPIIDDEIAMNLYCENSEAEGAATKRALLQAPGRKKFATLPESKVPGGFSVNGRTFFAASNLYELDGSGAVTNRGSLGASPVTPTQITANETQLVVLNNGNLFVLTLATNAFAAVNMAQFNGPVAQIEFLDGYIIATLQVSHTFQVSHLEDATTWSGLDIATISLFPDNITSMKVEHRYVWFFSAKKAVAYYNAGAGFPPFIPVQGEFLENGCGATFGTVELDNTLFWLDQSSEGFMVARRLGQGRISTHAVELAWQQYTVASDAVGWTYQEYGHLFWVIYFPTANATWCYDVATGFWHQRGYFLTANGQFIADRAMCHTLNFGIHLVGDWASGNIYQLSSTFFTDDGNPIRRLRRTPTVSDNNEWVYFESLEFIMETGLITLPDTSAPTLISMTDANGALRSLSVQDGGILAAPLNPGGPAPQLVFQNDVLNTTSWQITISGAGVISLTQLAKYNASYPIARLFVSLGGDQQWTLTINNLGGGLAVPSLTNAGPITRAPQLMLRWSNDGGKTWSNTYFLGMGKLGEYETRVIKRMLGRARKRLWEASCTDPVPVRFNDAVLKARPVA
jgi:hypothetical protein